MKIAVLLVIDVPEVFEPGQRVVVRETAGFSRGAHGVVKYQTPDRKVWVRRDYASSDAFFYPDELMLEGERA